MRSHESEPPFPAVIEIVGPDLSGDGQQFAAGQIKTVQGMFLRDHRKDIHRPGEPGDLQIKAEKPMPMVFV